MSGFEDRHHLDSSRTYHNLSQLSLDAGINIDYHRCGKAVDERPIMLLSDYLSKLSDKREFDPIECLVYSRFINNRDLTRTYESLRLHLSLFAKDLRTYNEMSEERKRDLIKQCCDLHSLMLNEERGHERRRLAA